MSRERSTTFSKLFLERAAGLKYYIRRLVGSRDTADEIVQEAFLRAYEHADRDRPVGPLVYAIARNLAVDHHRHERLAPADALGENADPYVVSNAGHQSLESWLLAEEQSALLKRAVELLPPQCRAAFTLRVFHCCSYKEIAVRLGIAEKTVEAHISRGMRETFRYLRQRYQLKDEGANHG